MLPSAMKKSIPGAVIFFPDWDNLFHLHNCQKFGYRDKWFFLRELAKLVSEHTMLWLWGLLVQHMLGERAIRDSWAYISMKHRYFYTYSEQTNKNDM